MRRLSSVHPSSHNTPTLQFSDGCAYNKNKLEQLYQTGFFTRTVPKAPKAGAGLKKEDVELIVRAAAPSESVLRV
jgi:hypothetical protein